MCESARKTPKEFEGPDPSSQACTVQNIPEEAAGQACRWGPCSLFERHLLPQSVLGFAFETPSRIRHNCPVKRVPSRNSACKLWKGSSVDAALVPKVVGLH